MKKQSVCPVCNHSYYQNRKTLVYECECNTTPLSRLPMETREVSPYLMKETVEILLHLNINAEQLNKLVSAIEAEKEESWSDGYATSVAEYEENEK